GVTVDPAEVCAEPLRKMNENGVLIEMLIDRSALLHELTEAGVELDDAELEEFVRNDVIQNPDHAIHGYLTIVQGILANPAPKGFLGIFPKKVALPSAKWRVTAITTVDTIGSSISLSGKAQVC